VLDEFGALLEEIDADALMNDGAAGLLSQRTEEDETGVAQAGAAATQTTRRQHRPTANGYRSRAHTRRRRQRT